VQTAGWNSIKLWCMRNTWAAVILLGCFAVAGCAKKDNLVGKWVGSIKLSQADKQNPKLVDAIKSMPKPTIEFKDDHTFVMPPIEGTWSSNDAVISMQPTKSGGKSISDFVANTPNPAAARAGLEKPLTMKLDDRRKTLTPASGTNRSGSSLTFTKVD